MDRINRRPEFDYMMNFVSENHFDDERSCDWLRMLWTAFCLHQGLDVDMRDYDECLNLLWARLEEEEKDLSDAWTSAETFDLFMCKYLC